VLDVWQFTATELAFAYMFLLFSSVVCCGFTYLCNPLNWPLGL